MDKKKCAISFYNKFFCEFGSWISVLKLTFTTSVCMYIDEITPFRYGVSLVRVGYIIFS